MGSPAWRLLTFILVAAMGAVVGWAVRSAQTTTEVRLAHERAGAAEHWLAAFRDSIMNGAEVPMPPRGFALTRPWPAMRSF